MLGGQGGGLVLQGPFLGKGLALLIHAVQVKELLAPPGPLTLYFFIHLFAQDFVPGE